MSFLSSYLVLAFLSLIVLCIFGYVANIVHLVKSGTCTGLTVARAVGVFVLPIGIICGFIPNKK